MLYRMSRKLKALGEVYYTIRDRTARFAYVTTLKVEEKQRHILCK